MKSQIDAAVLAVMREVPYVRKTGKVEVGRGYTYASEADLIASLRPCMLAHDLTLTPLNAEVVFQDQYPVKDGTMNRVCLRVAYRLAHAESGEHLTVVTIGEGADRGDKAVPKALTGAYKYALRQLFGVETGDDPDATPSSKQARRARPSDDAFRSAKEKVAAAPSAAVLAGYREKYVGRGYTEQQVAELDAVADRRLRELQGTKVA